MIDEVLPYPPIETLVKANHSLQTDNFLVHYNSRHQEHLNGNPVLELSELPEIRNDKTILPAEKAFLETLISKEPDVLASDLLESIEELFTSLKQSEPSDHIPSPTQAKVRRTAAVLYKNALIPQQEYNSGRTKAVFGPYGVNPTNIRNNTKETIDNLNCPIWKWTGAMPTTTKETDKVPSKTQYVRVSPKELDLFPFAKPSDDFFDHDYYFTNHEGLSAEKSLQRHNEIVAEHNLIEEVSHKLDHHPPYLPNINHSLSHQRSGIYTEYYPETLLSGNFKQRLGSIIHICDALEEMWRKCGVIFTDIKSANFRQKDGQPVLVDLGSMTKFDGLNQPALPILSLSPEFSPAFVPPEVINFKENLIRTEINIEPYLAFQIGALLVETFFPDEYSQELLLGNGNKWQNYDSKTDKVDDIVSINSSTLIALNNKYHGRITNQLADLLVKLLDNNPVYRPALAYIKRTLEDIAEQENLPELPQSNSEQNHSYSTNKQDNNSI